MQGNHDPWAGGEGGGEAEELMQPVFVQFVLKGSKWCCTTQRGD